MSRFDKQIYNYYNKFVNSEGEVELNAGDAYEFYSDQFDINGNEIINIYNSDRFDSEGKLITNAWPYYSSRYIYKHDWPQNLEPHYNTLFDVGDWWTSEGGEWKVIKDESAPRIYEYDSGWHDSYMDRDSKYESEESRYYEGKFHEPIISTYIPEAVRKVTYDVEFYRWNLSDKILDQMDLDMLMDMLRYLHSKNEEPSEPDVVKLIIILKDYLYKHYNITI